MGDMVHSLPAITDAARALPKLRIDWLVDRAFSEVPAWHSSVQEVIASPPRRLSNLPSREFRGFMRELRSRQYDLIVDLQGHWKSAFAASLAKGKTAGYDRKSVNEWGSHVFYNNNYSVSRNQHSIRRMKELLAQALNYSYDANSIRYGIDRTRLPANPFDGKEPYLVFIHSTSWESKCWPEDNWKELITQATQSGFSVALPWGTEAERVRAGRLADKQKAVVLPPLSISEKASVIAGATGTVGLDTGLSHIAAALDVPSVTMYGATDPFFIGATGKNQVHIESDFECVKCHRSTCNYPKNMQKPACFHKITPSLVWKSLERILKYKKLPEPV